MTRRLPASERTREALNELIDGRLRVDNARSDLVKLATRLIIEGEQDRGACGAA